MAAQLFREHGKCIFVGKCTRQKQVDDNQAESSGGKHVTRARGWWRRGDVCSTFRVRGLAAADTTATALVLLFGGRVEF
jgi:hypothetical protein